MLLRPLRRILLAATAVSVTVSGTPLRAAGLPILFTADPDARGAWGIASFGVSGRVTARGYRVREGMHDLSVEFVGARPEAAIEPCGGPPARLNFLRGSSRADWRTGLDAYECLMVREVWPGIDLRLSGAGGRWKSEWTVAPGADPSAIVLGYRQNVEAAPGGGLLVESPGGVWMEDPPVSFQPSPSGPLAVASRYMVRDGRYASFALGPSYDRRLPLVIDPVLTFGTLLGGAGISSANGVAVDQAGLVTIAGSTDSADFPVAAPIWPRPGGTDAFVARLQPNTGRILWATWLGGSGDDRATAVAIDQTGAVYVTGSTTSPNFPVSAAAQPALAGYRNAFLTKLGPNGDSVQFSTFFGGSASDFANALAVGANSVWIGGDATSADLNIVGGAGTVRKGSQDGFLARFSKSGVLEASTYLGGGGDETLRALALDASSNVYAGGGTTSTDLALPAGAYQPAIKGGQDGFVLKFNATLSQVLAGSYLGGTRGGSDGLEAVNALAVDSSGNVYAGGTTPSPDFPTPAAWLGTLGGTQDGFLVKFSSSLAGLGWGTYLGGSVRDSVTALAVGPDLGIWVAGSTTSTNFPLQSPLAASYAGNSDGFLLKMDPAGTLVPFSTYLGGTGSDGVLALAVAPAGSVYVAGQSGSVDLPQRNPAQAYTGTALRAFVLRIAAGALPSTGAVLPGAGTGSSQAFTFSATHSSGATQIGAVDLLLAGTLDSRNACLVRADTSTGKLALASDSAAAWQTVTPGSAEVAQNSQCALTGTGSSLTVSGVSVTAAANLTFRAAFAGARQIWANARGASGEETGFDLRGSWTASAPANAAPVAGAVTPSASSGPAAVFTASFSDANGATDIAAASLLVNSTATDAAACSVRLNRAANLLLLADDSGLLWRSGAPGGVGTLSNSQCVLNLASSSFTVAGNTLTLVVDIGFRPAFAGARNVYTAATDFLGATAPLAARIAFTVLSSPNLPPLAGTMSPASATGPGELLTFTYTDPNGAADIATPRVLINATQSGTGACFVAWDRLSGNVLLADDYGWTWAPVLPGSTGTVANSQCTVRGAGSRLTLDGLTLTMVLDLRFSPSFNGTKQVWANATDWGGLTSASPQVGTYTVAVQPNVAPVVGAVSPSSGTGAAQRFTVTYTDANGGLDIVRPRILINSSQAAAGGCFVEIDRGAGLLWLADDQGVAWSSAHLGTAEKVQNSQCAAAASGTSWSVNSITLAATFDLTFRASFNGAKNVYANATDAAGLTSTAPLVGTFTVAATANQAPVPVSVSPSSGTGAAQAFTVVWTDSNGAIDIETPRVLIHSQQRADGGCYFAYSQAAATVSLADDAGLGWVTTRLGSAEVLSNSQCLIRAAGSSLAASGNTLTGVADVVFRPAFNGAKSIWANATDSGGLTSAAPQLGTYTVNVLPNQAPVAVSVAPSSGSGKRQTFTLTWTDANGASDIETPRVLIHSAQRADSGCYVAGSLSNGLLYLADDAGLGWSAIRLGTGDTAQNSQCAIYGATSSFSPAANTLTATIDISFKSAFAGAKSIWANATDLGGLTSPAPLLGTYTVLP